jgi:predicted RNA-binding protein with PUA-like domain
MAYWLLKSEPSTWSWQDQKKAGAKGTAWDGVRNHLAKKHLMAMKKGDRAFFYHSGENKEIVGIVEIASTYRADPSDKTGAFGLVDLRAVQDLAKPISLSACKAEPRLKKMVLLNNSRLSVQPVTEAEWGTILTLGNTKHS